MGAIKLATSNSTDEEYGGTFPLDASDIPYDANTTVKQKIDEVASNLISGNIANNSSAVVNTSVCLIAIYRANYGLFALVNVFQTTATAVVGTLPDTITVAINSDGKVVVSNSVGYTIGVSVIDNPWTAI